MTDVIQAQKMIEAVERLKDRRDGYLNILERRAEALNKAMGKPFNRWAVPSKIHSVSVEGDMVILKGYISNQSGSESKTFSMPLDYANGTKADADEWLARMAKDEQDKKKKQELKDQRAREDRERREFERLSQKYGLGNIK